jgi:alkaline phosphatase
MAFDHERSADNRDEPSLAVMTTTAIDRLTRARAGSPFGYVLVIDAAGIDRAHHMGNTAAVIAETKALSDAVDAAVSKTQADNDTLIVITASHGHTLLNTSAVWRAEAAGGLPKKTSSGEDVPIYARGPGAQAIHGALSASDLHAILAGAILPEPDKKGADK